MKLITRLCGIAMSAALTVVAVSTPAGAMVLPGTSPVTGAVRGGSVAGACNYLFTGPSLDPQSSPFYIEGNAAYTGTATVAATELSCALRRASNNTEIGRLTLKAPGYTSAVANSIPVRDFGPYLICTMINIHFTDGGESNPNEQFTCRPLTSV